LIGVPTLSLTAVSGTRRETSITLAADHLFAVVLGSQGLQGRFDNTTTKTKDQMKSGFLLDVIVRESATIFQLLASKDQTLLIRGDTFLILDLLLDIVDRVGAINKSVHKSNNVSVWYKHFPQRGMVVPFHFKSDSLSSKSLDKDLHD
jgi:hypothetical protein